MDLLAFHELGTRFVAEPDELAKKAAGIKAVLFDWDGVFNNGFKDINGGSPFSEVDSMGVNLLRFALWLKQDRLPVAGIITGQHNPFAEKFAEREKLHAVHMGFTHKPEAFDSFLEAHDLKAEEVAFFFDDVLDLPVAARCGLRVLIGRKASAWFTHYAVKEHVDIVTANDGGHHGLREACELLMEMLGQGEAVLDHRVAYDATYQRYLTDRQAVNPEVFRKPR
jgi:3-deoxy-D-manno-octulosonate 8-phosphate phosphatase (KDO 8-P phosphatase)